MPYATRRVAIRYGLATLSVFVALLAHLSLSSNPIATELRYIILLLPVILSAWFGGRGPGILATTIGAMFADYLTRGDAQGPSELQVDLDLCLYVIEGVLISLLGGMLQQSESRNIAILRSAIDGVITLDVGGRIVEFNSAAEQMFGYLRREVLGRGLAELIVVPATPDGFDLQRFLNCNTPRLGTRNEMTGIHADGTQFPVELSLARLPQEGPPLLAGFVRDLRPHQRLEQQLKRRIQVARLLQHASTLSSTTRSFENVLQNCLDMVCEITGWPVGHIFLPAEDQNELIGSQIWHLTDPETFAAIRQELHVQRLRRGESLPGRIWKSGESEWVANVNQDASYSRYAPHWSRLGIQGAFGLPVKINNEVVAVMEFFTFEHVPPDSEVLELLAGIGEQLGHVIERRRREEQLRQAKDSAEAANRAKSEFLANVSHEVRTPMNAVLGMLQVVLSEELSPAVRDSLRTASESAKTLMALLNDLLDFSRMEAGRFQLDEVPFNVRQGIGSCIKTMSLKAQEKGLRLSWHIEPEVPDRLIGDVRRLQQVILNLAGNAIKFTEQGEVSIAVYLLKQGDTVPVGDSQSLEAKDDNPQVEEPSPSSPTTKEPTLNGQDQLRQRIVWREPTNPDTPLKVASPAEALDSVTKSADVANQPSEVILHLTVADTGIGIGPTDQARIFEPFTQVDSSSTRRHAGTGLGLTICCELIRRMGGVVWVESQLGYGSRFHCTARFGVPTIQRGATGSSDPAGVDELSTRASRPLRVLLAEDTPANQKVVSTILSKRGHQVEIARDGRETIKRVELESFDVVLMDVQMPNIDGYQATAAIRRLAGTHRAHVPIVAITAHAMNGDRERCLAAGMDDFVPKPIDVTELIHTVERVAAERFEAELISPSDWLAQHSRDSTIHELEQPQHSADCVIDRAAAVKRLGGDERLFRDLVRFFDEDTPGLLEEIRRGIHVRDYDRVTRSAHSLKGLTSNFNAVDAMSAAARLMEIGRSQLDGPAALAFRDLEREISRLRDALAPYRSSSAQ